VCHEGWFLDWSFKARILILVILSTSTASPRKSHGVDESISMSEPHFMDEGNECAKNGMIDGRESAMLGAVAEICVPDSAPMSVQCELIGHDSMQLNAIFHLRCVVNSCLVRIIGWFFARQVKSCA